MVEHVEGIDPELEAYAFLDREFLLKRHVEVDLARSIEEVHTGFQTQASRRGCEEASRIQPVERIVRVRVSVASLNYTDARAFRIRARQVLIAGSRNGEARSERRAAHDLCHAGELPAVREQAGERVAEFH